MDSKPEFQSFHPQVGGRDQAPGQPALPTHYRHTHRSVQQAQVEFFGRARLKPVAPAFYLLVVLSAPAPSTCPIACFLYCSAYLDDHFITLFEVLQAFTDWIKALL